MRAFAKRAGRVLLVAGTVLGLAACGSAGHLMENAVPDTGATPGTVPGHIGAPSGPMDNGLMPEPWGSTS